MRKRKIALFGGTFDPIHLGHTRTADASCEIIGAEKVIFIPAKRSALKLSYPIASDEQRMAMISHAIEGCGKFELSDYEIKKAFPSFTLHTVRWFREQFGTNVSIHWLLGADSVKDLPLWYEIKTLIDECVVTIMRRPGYDDFNLDKYIELWGEERVEKLKQNSIETPLIDISSTEIRYRLAKGYDVSQMLDEKVAKYILENRIYKTAQE